jgi:hypothetical protein
LYINRGTARHFVKDNTLFNVFAWGGECFSNRSGNFFRKIRDFDLKLYGNHVIRYSLVPHSADFRLGDYHRTVAVKNFPPISKITPCNKAIPREKTFFCLENENLSVSDIIHENGGICLRCFENSGVSLTKVSIDRFDNKMDVTIRSLDNEKLGKIGKYQIFNIQLRR